MKIADKYIFKALVSPFLVSFFCLSFVFIMSQIIEITNLVINYKASIISMFLMLFYLSPEFLRFTLPLSVMIAVLTSFIRLSSDNEIIILRSSGISLFRLFIPVFFFCLLALIITAWVTLYGISLGKIAFKKELVKMANQSSHFLFKEKVFNHKDNVLYYIDKIEPISNELKNVFIQDRSSPNMVQSISAPSGILITNKEKALFILRLFNGIIVNIEENSDSSAASFESYDLAIDMQGKKQDTSSLSEITSREKNIVSLYKDSKNLEISPAERKMLKMYFHRNLSIPVSCIIFGFAAFVLALRNLRWKQFASLKNALLLFFVYYALTTVAWTISEAEKIPAYISLWLPNLITLTVSYYIFKRASRGLDL